MESNKEIYSKKNIVEHYSNYKGLQKPEETIFNILSPKLNEMKMLDIGVGGGRTTEYFKDKVKEYIGVDFSEGMIAECRKKFSNYPKLKFDVCDVRDLSRFKNEEFDFVLFSFNGLDNINHEERLNALKEIRRICKKGGYFCFSSHNLNYLNYFFKIKFRFNIFKLIASIPQIYKLRKRNKEQIKKINSSNYLLVYDDVYDFGLYTYYVNSTYQNKILEEIGFKTSEVFSLKSGTKLEEKNNAENSWLYYLTS